MSTTDRFLSLSDLSQMPAPMWAIEGLFEKGTLTMVAGPSYSFKSFLLLDWLMCMAAGREWQGRKTVSCKVAYVLGEGKSSLLKRIMAWLKHNQPTPEEMVAIEANLRLSFDVPQLGAKSSVDNMLADLNQADFKPEIIAIDTFARSMVGLDENDAKDTGMWIDQADRLRQLGYGVIFTHHTKKSTEFGVQYRGSTAIMGAMDTAMTLVRDHSFCTLTITKQKDHDEGAPLRFKRVLVDIGGGDSSCVLLSAPAVDERFPEATPEVPQVDPIIAVIDELMLDGSYSSDRARGRELSKRCGLTESAGQSRVANRRERMLRDE